MALIVGSRLGAFEITGTLGAGGMGEVYRATDTNLGRQVAIKVLPDAFAQDAERLARFEREAKTLAALNHPNIAQIYGLEKGPAAAFAPSELRRPEEAGHYVRALVMELVEGPTLADRIAQGAIPIDEALPIAKQIADALEAAHEQSIIHRDLKPANIKLRPDGVVKVLDFGLAKALGPPEGGHYVQNDRSVRLQPDLTAAPTITTPAMMTNAGVILGTAADMIPEQARGKAVDKRTDIWAFGCVLFEMMTGRRCFEGEDVADTLAFVLTKEPDWAALPPDTPPSMGNLLRRCLEKDRRKRIGETAVALFAIDEAGTFGTVARASSPAIAARPASLWRRLTTYSTPALVAAAIAGGAVWVATLPLPPRVSRLAITTTPVT
ncbi:MAG: serine/threonine-protein kinase, partial [Vicinamibacterales bacterium]